MSCLAADIGGTYSRFAWLDAGEDRQTLTDSFANAGIPSLESAISRALTHFGRSEAPIGQMVLALPGPVHTDAIQLTNIDWLCERTALIERFRPGRLLLVNDFQAAALGAVAQPIEHLRVLNKGAPVDGPRVVAGAGTGLGLAWFADSAGRALPTATEGGHMDFAPGNRTERELQRHLAERFGHVSYERLLSGAGLVAIYRFLGGDSAPLNTPAEIAEGARQRDPMALAAVRLLVDVTAGYAGNLALAFNPGGGIYLCGGLLAHLSEWFDPEVFGDRYGAKGRMSDFVRRIPVFLVTRHGNGLTGAITIARDIDRADT